MKTLKINKKKYYLPEAWEEVTVATYSRLLPLDGNYSDTIRFIALMLNIDKDELSNSTLKVRDSYRIAMKLISDQESFNTLLPPKKKFLYKETLYKIPRDLEMERFGQNIMLRDRMATSDPSEMIAFTVALYMQPVMDGKFDNDKIIDLETEVQLLPITEIYPLAYHFFLQLSNYKRLGQIGLNKFI